MTAPITPFHGFGLGLRRPHFSDFLEGAVDVDFLEVISENYMVEGGRMQRVIDEVGERYPLILHGVSMSIGSAHGLDRAYLERLKRLERRTNPLWVSDHLCWTRSSAHNSFDLLPLPLTEEALDVVCANITVAQDILGRALLLENPSSYLTFPQDEMREWEFLSAACARTGCYLLLDVNNIYVSAQNHGFDAQTYLEGLPLERVRQIHLAGHRPGEIIIDTHDEPVAGPVWELYAQACAMLDSAGVQVATMIERDGQIPALDALLGELDHARRIAQRALTPGSVPNPACEQDLML